MNEGAPELNVDATKQEVSVQETFEQQFAKREFIKVAGGTAEVIDVKPETQKDEVPVLFAPSWACDLSVYEPTFKKITEEHRRVVSLNHPRIGNNREESKTELGVEPTKEITESPEQLRKALNLLGVMKEKGLERVDVVTHSEGAINTVFAALMNPEKFRNIVFFAPAGVIGEDTFSRLLKGFAGQGKRADSMKDIEVTPDEKLVAARAGKSVLKYAAKNPLRGLKETLEISRSQIHEMLRYLHEQGIGIVLMCTIDDPVFPMENVQGTVKGDMVDGFLSLVGGHGEIGNHPEMFIPVVQKMIDALEAKKARKKELELAKEVKEPESK